MPLVIRERLLSSKQIAFHSDRDGDFEIFVMNADGGVPKQLTNNDESNDWSPNWSCDDKIAFESNRDGNFEIYVMNSDGTNQSRLTNNLAKDYHPSWSPNGKQIAFMTNRHDPDDTNGDDYQIYIMNNDSTNSHRLTHDQNDNRNPDWSPDGRQIVFQSRGKSRGHDDYEIYIMNVDGTHQSRRTYFAKSNEQHPAWSPDGKQIAFETNRAGFLQIYEMNVDGTNANMLTETSTPGRK